MAVYVVTGKLGGGKSLVSVARIRDKLMAGCIVATNLDLKLHKLLPVQNRTARIIRIPDQPTADDLSAIGIGNASYDETQNGLLLLDECGTWFNARNWNDKSRKGVNDWFLHARKLGWDVLLIVQDVEILDSQARRAIAEHTVFCRRIDRLHIPVIGTFYKLLVGEPLRLPRLHIGKVVYGTSENDALADRWSYRGTALFSCYDTKQKFLDDYPNGVHSLLTPWHTHGRYQRPRDWRHAVRMTKIYWKRFRAPFALALGIAVGAGAASYAVASALGSKPGTEQEPVHLVEPEPLPSADVQPGRSDIAERIAAFQIVGYVQMGQKSHYHLAQRGSEPGERGIPIAATSADLIRMGAGMRAINECHAVFTHGGDTVPVYCR